MTRTLAAVALALGAVGCLHPYQAHPCARPDLAGCVIEKVSVSGGQKLDASAVTDKIATAETSHALGGVLEDVPILSIWDRITVDYELLDPFVLERDLARVERVYKSHGYYEAHARAARVVKQPRQDRVRVDIAVEEGLPVLISEVSPVWLGAPPPKPIVDMVHGILRELPVGKPLDEDNFDAVRKRLRRALTDAGYAYAHTYEHAEVDLLTHKARVTYTIGTGPRCTFGAITLEGYGDLPEYKLRQAVHIQAGQKYSTERIEQAQGALSDLRVLGSVVAVPQLEAPSEPSEPVAAVVFGTLGAAAPRAALPAIVAIGEDTRSTVIPVVFKVTPTTLRTLKMGVGAEVGSNVEAHGLASWDVRNFLGGLRHFTVEAKPGLIFNPLTFATLFSKPVTPLQVLFEVRVHAELEQPGFIEPRTRGVVSLAANLYQLQPLDTLGYFELAGKTGVARDFWGKRVSSALYLNMAFDQPTKLDDYTPIDTAHGYNKLVLPYVESIGVLDLRTGEDGKHDPLNPHSGVYLSNDVQVAFIDSADVRIKPEVRGYVPIAKRLTLALRGTFGLLYAFGGVLSSTPAPACPYATTDRCVGNAAPGVSTVDRSRYIQVLQLRGFNSGGPTSNRGYAYNGVGPQELIPNISPIQSDGSLLPIATGGKALWEASAELRFPLYQKLGATLFADASDVRWSLAELANPFAPHLSTGLGLRYLTPVGPFRADFGVRVPGAQVIGPLGKGACPAYDPNGGSSCYIDAHFGQASPVFSLPMAISLAIGEAF